MSTSTLAYLECAKCRAVTLHNMNACPECGTYHVSPMTQVPVATFNNQRPQQSAARQRRLNQRLKAGAISTGPRRKKA